MSWLAEHWLALSLLAAYTALIAHHAWVGQQRTKTVTDYYVGGRSMGGIALGLSFFATFSSTNSFVGFAGQGYDFGVAWLLVAPCAVIFSLLAWRFVAPRLRAFTAELDSVTIPDYVGFRFSSNAARVAAAVIVVFASFLYMTAVFKGIGNLLEIFLDLPYRGAVGVVFVIVVLYTMVGGFISVVKTDAVQGVVMVFAGALLFGGTVRAAGGLDSVRELADGATTKHLFHWDAAMAFPVLLGIIVASFSKLMVEPRQLSRFYALQDRHAARRGMVVSTLAFLVVYSLLLPIGLYARRIVPGGVDDTDQIVPLLLTDASVFPLWIGAFLLVAMVAAAMSSLDSVLLVTATTMQRDLVGQVLLARSDEQALRNTRILVAVLAAITALIALDPPGQIVALTAFSGSLYAACFFPAVVLGLHWRRGNGATVLASFVVGVGVLLAWRSLPFGADIHQVFPAVALSTLVYVAGTLILPTPDDPTLDRLFVEAAAD